MTKSIGKAESFPVPPFAPVLDETPDRPEDHHARMLLASSVEGHAGCCDHSSASTRRRFKAALKQLGIPIGVMHDSCFGLMNHLDGGEEYRWQNGKVEQFDREAYVWNLVEVK